MRENLDEENNNKEEKDRSGTFSMVKGCPCFPG